jgi:hypothetical protein
MTKLLDQAIASIRKLPDGEQDIAARFLLEFANVDAVHVQLTDEQVAEVEIAKEEVRQGRLATEADMDAVWRRFNR